MRDRCDSALDRYPHYPPGFSPRELDCNQSPLEEEVELEEEQEEEFAKEEKSTARPWTSVIKGAMSR